MPAGFCVTTDAFRRTLTTVPFDRLSSAEIRQTIEATALPDDLETAIAAGVQGLGEQGAYAVRSSATAEDLPGASFAGQQDTYLNIVGTASVIDHVRRCWASLFTERAVAYRVRNGIDHGTAQMAVIVQRMVPAEVAGVLFTADPVTGNRKVARVEAVAGLGDRLVSGLVTPDAELTDEQAAQLVELGRRIEAHFGRPQDIEWCFADGEFWIVQSRPITTLYPIPEASDGENHVYVSVGHGQMMTEAMTPLGVSVWQLTAMAPMLEAGGRLFVDVTARLASPATRGPLLDVMGRGDPLIGDALQTIVERGDFLPSVQEDGQAGTVVGSVPAEIDTDPAIVTELIERSQASIAALKRDIQTKSGTALFEFLLEAFKEHKRVLADPLSYQAIIAGMQATWWLNDQLETWLGEKNAADTLTLAAPGNVTSEMGLGLLDVADVIRPHAQIVEFLQGVEDEAFLDELVSLPGGREAREAIEGFLAKYGMRCVGEIDITRPRWSERPSTLVPLILDNVRNFRPGEAERRLERGREAAAKKELELLERLEALDDGGAKAQEAKRMIDRVRTFSGYREYPKYGIISRYFVYKQALMKEAERLAEAGVIAAREVAFYLTFDELRDVVRTRRAEERLIRERKEAFRSHQALTPPRVITSDGEVVAGTYKREGVPEGALIGLAVSSGTVEGRARVIRDLARADLEPGDILVTTFTDPSWTPLFLAIKGLVTEVGGLMTHGAVIAREYGLPAVVGVEQATELIKDGQRIRLNGTDGYVEILG